MRVKVVGTGSMWNKYNSACYLVDDDIMIDFPNGACKYLYRFDIIPHTINYLLITHFHGDHYFDIPFYFLNKSKSDNKKVNIYCSNEGTEKIKKIGMLAFPNSFEDAVSSIDLKYNYDETFKIKEYIISKMLVDHGRMKPAYGYIFEKDKMTVGFTGDTALCNAVEYMASLCNYLFCDCMFVIGTKKHQGINDIVYLANKYPNCNFIVSHMEDSARSELKNSRIKNIIVPEDGDVIEIK
jgi:ribonuclease BN (tRNA processing enzyme)